MAPVRPERSICSALAVLIMASVGAGLQMLPYREGLYFALFQLLFWLPAGCLSASLAATFSLSCRRHRFLRRRATS
jgi:hypothetical protein